MGVCYAILSLLLLINFLTTRFSLHGVLLKRCFRIVAEGLGGLLSPLVEPNEDCSELVDHLPSF